MVQRSPSPIPFKSFREVINPLLENTLLSLMSFYDRATIAQHFTNCLFYGCALFGITIHLLGVHITCPQVAQMTKSDYGDL